MQKLKLEDLAVESFSTSDANGGAGTVKGHIEDPDATAGPYTCYWTCNATCGDKFTCGPNGNTCHCYETREGHTCGVPTCVIRETTCGEFTAAPEATCNTYYKMYCPPQ